MYKKRFSPVWLNENCMNNLLSVILLCLSYFRAIPEFYYIGQEKKVNSGKSLCRN